MDTIIYDIEKLNHSRYKHIYILVVMIDYNHVFEVFSPYTLSLVVNVLNL